MNDLDFKMIARIFLISSSLPMFIVTMTYIGLAFRAKGRPSDVPYEFVPVIIPLLLGIFGVINYYAVEKYNKNASLVVGILFGLVLSTFGRSQGVPIKLFDLTAENQYRIHIAAALYYATIFRFIITPVLFTFTKF